MVIAMAQIPVREPVRGISMPSVNHSNLQSARQMVEVSEDTSHTRAGTTILGRGDTNIPIIKDGQSVGYAPMPGSESPPADPTVVMAERPEPPPSQRVEVVAPEPTPTAVVDIRPPEERQGPKLSSSVDKQPELPTAQPPVALPQSEPRYAPPAPPKPRRIVIKSRNMGKHTVVVADVVVSETIVCVFYENDGSMTIVEPPPCGPDEPIQITINPNTPDAQTFPVMYGEWTAEIGGRLLVVFARIIDYTGTP